jgi:hypothetical protein
MTTTTILITTITTTTSTIITTITVTLLQPPPICLPLWSVFFYSSYTNFNYSNIVVPKEIKPCDQAVVTAELKNIGTRSGDEVIAIAFYRPYISISLFEVKTRFLL